MFSTLRNRFQYLPTVGCILFLILITITSIYYPGGSEVEECSKGYSWIHNYLCDVIADVTHSNSHHPLHRVGLTAMICLCGGISIFFFYFPYWLNIKGLWKIIIKWMGFTSMLFAMLIFTDLHNIMIAVASILALPALTGVFIALHQQKRMKAFYVGILILLLLALNNIIYYTDFMVIILPQLQKLSCLTVIIWIIYMNFNLSVERK